MNRNNGYNFGYDPNVVLNLILSEIDLELNIDEIDRLMTLNIDEYRELIDNILILIDIYQKYNSRYEDEEIISDNNTSDDNNYKNEK